MDAIQKAARVEKQTLAGEELALINRQALKELTEEEVFVFRVAACDNQVDRDQERFTEAAPDRLAALYVGKPVIMDHRWSASGQTARIYRTEVVREPGSVTAAGDEYRWLKGWSCWPNNSRTNSGRRCYECWRRNWQMAFLSPAAWRNGRRSSLRSIWR